MVDGPCNSRYEYLCKSCNKIITFDISHVLGHRAAVFWLVYSEQCVGKDVAALTQIYEHYIKQGLLKYL